MECLGFTLPSCARCSARRHSEGEALGGETENLLQIKQFSILRIFKRVRNQFMYITTHLIDFITIMLVGFVYFSHMLVYQWIQWGWETVKSVFGVAVNNSLLNYLLTALLATDFGIIIDALSRNRKFAFLKNLYS